MEAAELRTADADYEIRFATPDDDALHAIVELLAPTYWCEGVPRRRIEAAFRHSTVVVIARRRDGSVVGTARALSDHGRRAFVFDVVVAESHRHRGVGRAMVAALLGHDALLDTSIVWLATRDKVAFYERFGFVVLPHANPRPDGNTEMVLRRD